MVKNKKRGKKEFEFISNLIQDKTSGLVSSEKDFIGDKKSGARQVCKSSPSSNRSRISVSATNKNKELNILIN